MTPTQAFLDTLRAEIRNLPQYNAGVSTEYVRSNYHVQEVAKLGSNENSHGTSPHVLAAIARAVQDVALYPDSFGNELRNALSLRLKIPSDRIVLGTDYPYWSGEHHVAAVRYIEHSDLPPETVERILRRNAAALFPGRFSS